MRGVSAATAAVVRASGARNRAPCLSSTVSQRNRGVPTRKLFVIPAIALAAVAFAAGPAAAPAPAATTCQLQFDALRDDTRAVDITARDPDRERAGLFKLIDDAEALVGRGKTSDATTKLGNFQIKIDQLEAAGRISEGSADQLHGDADAAIACLQSSTV